MVVTLPFVLLLVDAWPLGQLGGLDPEDPFEWRRLGPLVREKVPLFVLAGLSSVATVVAQSGSAAATLGAIPLGDRVGNALVSYVVYLEKTFWPTGLAAFYPPPWVGGPALRRAGVAGSQRRILPRGDRCGVPLPKGLAATPLGLALFLGTLLPVIGIVQVGLQSHADRYTYIPTIGILVAVTWVLAGAARRPRRSPGSPLV